MKNNRLAIILFAIIAFTFVACDKDDAEEIPTNNPSGNYFYESNSVYSDANGDVENKVNSNGSIQIKIENSILSIAITPSIGYSFTIEASNLKDHGDTTTFSIYRQQIDLKSNTYNVQGLNGVDVGPLGHFDGYYTKDNIVFDYRSINVSTLESVRTQTHATKRN